MINKPDRKSTRGDQGDHLTPIRIPYEHYQWLKAQPESMNSIVVKAIIAWREEREQEEKGDHGRE